MEEKKRKCTIYVNIGLPASGKTTETKELLKSNGNLMRVNRDELRAMLFPRWKGRKESVVSEMETQAVRSIVGHGYDAVIDDTNLNPGTRAKWKALAESLGVVLVEKSFNTPIQVCIQRDAARVDRAHVGRGVIESMALTHGLFPKLDSSQQVVIFDVDGTLADMEDRRQYLKTVPKDYERFYDYAILMCDKPRDTIIEWSRECYKFGYVVLIVSGRPMDRASDATVDWLKMYDVRYDHLFMRNGQDRRDDEIVKQEILDKILNWIPKEQILFAVDDRPRVVRMWRKNNICVYDVGEGVEF